ncbi:MAG: PDZ domain-containing protein [Planctomycetes bacterium]|nr:PDZ domain-containing protein [Planctomycetota bacterium]
MLLLAPVLHAQDPPAAPPPRTALALQQDFVQIAAQVFPSVVSVRTFVRGATPAPATKEAAAALAAQSGWVAAPSSERDYPGFRPHRHASGFFVAAGDAEGEVLTTLTALRVDGEQLADLVEVETMDGQRMLADVVGIEPTLRLAVLRCAVFPSWAKPSMRPLRFGDSDTVPVGAWMLGFGDPLGPERFLGTGLLVAKPSRDCYQELLSATYMQATMLVPPDAEGGPLVDLDGNVVGILARLDVGGAGQAAGLGSAWALPSKILQGLYESIRVAGTTRSPWLGLSVMSRAEIATTRGLPAFTAMKKPNHGILIENVFAPSPAATAGIRPDDFLTHFAGVQIHAPVDFQRQLYLAGVGAAVELKMFRDGREYTATVTIEPRPAAAQPR